jgi:hypothetical protein
MRKEAKRNEKGSVYDARVLEKEAKRSHFALFRLEAKKFYSETVTPVTLFMKRYGIHFSIYALHISGSMEGVGGEGVDSKWGGEGVANVCYN